ncbi:hypothetical protein [Allofrancisella guangzhouensis]|nr:hypothetical protein [Allofrancisella guangzhouensis]
MIVTHEPKGKDSWQSDDRMCSRNHQHCPVEKQAPNPIELE